MDDMFTMFLPLLEIDRPLLKKVFVRRGLRGPMGTIGPSSGDNWAEVFSEVNTWGVLGSGQQVC